jgi:hypothetical protein
MRRASCPPDPVGTGISIIPPYDRAMPQISSSAVFNASQVGVALARWPELGTRALPFLLRY